MTPWTAATGGPRLPWLSSTTGWRSHLVEEAGPNTTWRTAHCRLPAANAAQAVQYYMGRQQAAIFHKQTQLAPRGGVYGPAEIPWKCPELGQSCQMVEELPGEHSSRVQVWHRHPPDESFLPFLQNSMLFLVQARFHSDSGVPEGRAVLRTWNDPASLYQRAPFCFSRSLHSQPPTPPLQLLGQLTPL